VVPVPPPDNSGGVKFTTVVLSLAYDDLASGVKATGKAQILRGGAAPVNLSWTVPAGRTPIATLHANDQAVAIETDPGPNGKLAVVTALVEYTTP
jgi:hypothetical protein